MVLGATRTTVVRGVSTTTLLAQDVKDIERINPAIISRVLIVFVFNYKTLAITKGLILRKKRF